MKRVLIIALIAIGFIISCKKEEIIIDNPSKDIPNFVGTWSRTYPILGNNFVATYSIDTSKIIYSNQGDGPGNSEYSITFDSFKESDNRWIGHTTENQYYLIFFKDISESNITIYKQKVNNPNDAQTIEIPSEDNQENYGWNTYDRQ